MGLGIAAVQHTLELWQQGLFKNAKKIKKDLEKFNQYEDELLEEYDAAECEVSDEPDFPLLTIHIYPEGLEDSPNVQELSKLYQRITKKTK